MRHDAYEAPSSKISAIAFLAIGELSLSKRGLLLLTQTGDQLAAASIMAEYLRTHNVRLKKEGSRNRFIPNGRSYSNYGRGVAGAARLIKALGDDYGR